MSSPSNSAASSPGDWRASVQQSHRNTEVREISRVLAALEPGASASSKLRLAMQFEDTVFKAATSLTDYRKKLTKRLKKLQKTYVPPQQQVAHGGAAAAAKREALLELRQTYGESLLYILKHADMAVKEMKLKHGEEKGKQLQQHTDGVKAWAADLGLLDNTKANVNMSDDHLERLRLHLERRTENIRQHVVKLADTDQFMMETINKVEEDFRIPKRQRANLILGEITKRRYEHLHRDGNKVFDGEQLLAESMKEARAQVPLQTRSQDDQGRSTALLQLRKMRAASSVLLACMGIKEKEKIPPGTLVQAHKIAKEGADVVMEVMQKYRQDNPESELSLEDAWMKPLVLATSEQPATESKDNESPSAKRPRLIPVSRSRVLLTARRKTPSNLIPALKRKRVRLIRPPGEGSHLILEFGQAFVMTIYLVPLIVTLRAADLSENGSVADKPTKQQDNASGLMTQCATWTPLHYGLTNRDNSSASAEHRLSLWGAKGDYDTLGPLVQERLRDASAQATHVLRQCFSRAAHSTNDFETEILEATALLEFLQVARTTFIPNWQDDDV